MFLGLLRRQALLGLQLAELHNKVLCIRIDVGRKLQVAFQNRSASLFLAGRPERGLANDHLIQEHTHRPHVQALVVTLAADHLRRQVVRRSAKGGAIASAAQDVGPTEVCKLGVSITVQQDILGFDVSMDHLLGQSVQVLQGIAHLKEILRCLLQRELPILTKLIKHAAASSKLHAEINVRSIPKVEPQLDNVWVPKRSQDRDLPLHLLRQIVLLQNCQWNLLDKLLLGHCGLLDCKGRRIYLWVPCALRPLAFPDLSEVATPELPDENKVRGTLWPRHRPGCKLRTAIDCGEGTRLGFAEAPLQHE
mmetsp:Transcript_56218/g.182442  ORF Transcript_56218/g.182442 Transcript_56218/m.182442 type:complete len:307 (-) Transcript_56218:27-947(-)